MRFPPALSILVLASCSGGGDTQTTTVVGGLYLQTPAIAISGVIDSPEIVVVTAWVSARDAAAPSELTPIDGADARVQIDDSAVALGAVATGAYGATSAEVSELVYRPGTTYAFVAETNGVRRGVAVDAAPEQLVAAAVTLAPQPTAAHPAVPEALLHPANTALSLTFPAQYGAYAFVSVYYADPATSDAPVLVFSDRPGTARAFEAAVASSRGRTVEVPARVFGSDGIYIVFVSAMKLGTDRFPNTDEASAILVGSSAAIAIGVDS